MPSAALQMFSCCVQSLIPERFKGLCAFGGRVFTIRRSPAHRRIMAGNRRLGKWRQASSLPARIRLGLKNLTRTHNSSFLSNGLADFLPITNFNCTKHVDLHRLFYKINSFSLLCVKPIYPNIRVKFKKLKTLQHIKPSYYCPANLKREY